MDDARARSMFLFGTEDPPGDIDEVYPDLIRTPGDLNQPGGWRLVRAFVARQILVDEPPETWATAQRLLAGGLDRSQALDELARAWYFGYTAAAQRVGSEGDDVDEERLESEMRAVLDALPLPDLDDIEHALIDEVAAEQGIDGDDLVERVTMRFDAEADSTIAFMTSVVLADAIDAGATLSVLPGRRVVNHAEIAGPATLTHRLTINEIASGVLARVGTDLCLFAHVAPFVEGRGDRTVRLVDAHDGSLGWRGPDGWLADFAPGDLISVRMRRRHDGADVISVDRAPEVEASEDVTTALADAFERLVAISGMATLVGTMVTAAVVADELGLFIEPQPPISELCEAAGLELRHSFVGADPAHWTRLSHELRHDRVHQVVVDDTAHRVLDLVEKLERPSTSGADVRRALRAIAESPGIVDNVVAELFPVGRAATIRVPLDYPDSAALIERLEREAGWREEGVVTYLAALADERAGHLARAEARLLAGYADEQPFDPIVDRLGWYASDRGDAETALRLWGSIGIRSGEAVAVLRDAALPARQLGRNDRCWCGSGRKFKACHLGQKVQASLAERVAWLWHKGKQFLISWDVESNMAVVVTAVALAGSEHDAARGDAVRDPLITDTTLFEGGWFARFLEQRGPLLPEDERALAADWLDVRRSVFEVENVEGDGAAVVRDLRNDERFTVDAPHDIAGDTDRWCLRVVPDGTGHQVVGGRFPVVAGSEEEVLALCDRADPIEICSYAGSHRR